MGLWVLVQTQVLYNIGVPYCTEVAALLFKSSHESHCSRVIELKQGGVKHFDIQTGLAFAVPLLTPTHHEWTHKNIYEYAFINIARQKYISLHR